MSTFLVSYDLRKPGRDYSSLYAAIKSYPRWAHPLESVWVIVTDETAFSVRDHLRQKIDANDGLLVVKSAGVGAWSGLSQKLTDWLKQHL